MFELTRRKRARRPALEMLEGRVLLTDNVALTAGSITITGSNVAGNLSNLVVQWFPPSTTSGGIDIYQVTELNPNVTFAAPTGTAPGGVGVLVGPPGPNSPMNMIQISGLTTSGGGASLAIKNGLNNGTALTLNSIGPLGITVTNALSGATETVTIGTNNNIPIATQTLLGLQNAGLQNINGTVAINDSSGNGAATNLTIDDTGDTQPAIAAGISANQFSATLNPGPTQKLVTVAFVTGNTQATLDSLTFNTTNSNGTGTVVAVTDVGLAAPGPGVAATAVTVNANSSLDKVAVASTAATSTLTINGQSGQQVAIGNNPTVANFVQSLQPIQGGVTLNGPMMVNVSNTGNPTPLSNAAISTTGISGLPGAQISFGSTPPATLGIFGGPGGNTFTVAASVLAGTALNVVGAGGGDALNLNAATVPLTITPAGSQSTVVFTPTGSNGTLTAMVGTVNITSMAVPQSAVAFNATQGTATTQEVGTFVLPVAPAPASAVSGLNVQVSINWGDGSAPSAGSVVQDGTTPGLFHVMGTHTFSAATAANSPDSVVATITGFAPFTLNSVTITPMLALPLALAPAAATVVPAGSGNPGGGTTPLGTNFVMGALSPASDSGSSNSDLITNNPTPVFLGTTNPGAKVTLLVQGLKSFTSPTPIGTAVADGNGNWTITSFAVPGDSYQFTAESVDTNGSTATAALTTAARPLVVDLAGPVIQSATLSAKAKQIVVVFTDAMGLNVATLANPAAYAVSGKGVSRITTLNVSGTGTTVTVALTFATRKGFAGKLTFLVRAAGVTNTAGNPLDGKFAGRFPSGNGVPGGNFLATLPIKIAKKRAGGGVTVIFHP